MKLRESANFYEVSQSGMTQNREFKINLNVWFKGVFDAESILFISNNFIYFSLLDIDICFKCIKSKFFFLYCCFYNHNRIAMTADNDMLIFFFVYQFFDK